MPGESTVELQTLYFELGDAWARENKLGPAADVYALAHYYAKRSQNLPLADLCREQMLLCQADHPAAKEDCSPLFYAQLLMRYPMDEATRILKEHKDRRSAVKPVSSTTSPTPVVANAKPYQTPAVLPTQDFAVSSDVMASAEPYPSRPAGNPVKPISPSPMPTPPSAANPASNYGGGVGVLDYPTAPPFSQASSGSGLASLFGAPSAPASYPGISLPPVEPYGAGMQPNGHHLGHSGFEHHHASPMGVAPAYASRAISDFEFGSRANVGSPGYSPRANYDERSTHQWLTHLAGMVATAGVMILGFLGYQAWPDLQKIDLDKAPMVVEQAMSDARMWYQQHQHLWRASEGNDRVTPSEESSGADDSIGEPVSVSNEPDRSRVQPVLMEVVPPAPPVAQSLPETLPALPASSTEFAAPPRPMNWTSSKVPAEPLPPLGK